MAAPRIPRETNPLCWLWLACMLVATALALVLLLSGCGGGDSEELPCGHDFVGPIAPGSVAPGCEATGGAG